jgi:hypothetical protein
MMCIEMVQKLKGVQFKILHQRRSKSTLPVGQRVKKLFFPLQCYNLTIRAVKFCKTFCTCSSSSIGQDPTVESIKSEKKFHLRFLS